MKFPRRLDLGLGALLAGLVAAAACKTEAQAPTTPPPAPVVVAKAEIKTVPISIRGIGNVEAIASVAVRSRVAGQILDVHVTDGADVTRGQTLFEIDPAPYKIALAATEAQLARDEALHDKAQSDVARYEKLVAKEYVTREQYESTTSQAASLAETIRADKAAVDQAKLDLSYCTIAAPIAGRTGSVTLRAGNLVKANDDPPLVTILQTHPIYVNFSVPERYLGEVRARAAEGSLPVHALNRGETRDGHLGKLAFVDNAVDVTTGTIRLRGEFPNDDRALWPGEFVEVSLTVGEQKNVVVVPSSAIQVGQQGNYVYVVGQDMTAKLQPVVVDRAVGTESILAQGVSGGETIIVDGQIRVVPGAKVAAQAATP